MRLWETGERRLGKLLLTPDGALSLLGLVLMLTIFVILDTFFPSRVF